LFKKNEEVLAGMIATESSLTIKVNRSYDQSYISKIMHMVEEASARKAKTQRMIGRLAKVYTPIVFFLAIALIFVPWFFDNAYTFDKWFYRGLVFLVISCPCAFLIAIPLSYFGGIGLAASKGILFKGGEVIESLAKLKAIVFDKTGTVTDGKFKIDEINFGDDRDLRLAQLIALESHSTHPLARAVINGMKPSIAIEMVTQVKEYPGKGISGRIAEDLIMAGNYNWFINEGIEIKNIAQTGKPVILLAVNKKYVGSISFSDRLKTKSKIAFEKLKKIGIDHMYILSGDKQAMADQIGNELGITKAFGELMPDEKVNEFIELRKQHQPLGFVGDGVNDAPVLAVSDVGFAMGAAGSDAAIESADVVIENDDLTKISAAIKISKKTQRNVWQNLTLALVVKLVVLILGAEGIATLWEAIFADVGVALLAVLNAYRLKFQ
jgi:Cd2+/Zn2+-exporting ATPase